MEVKHRAAGKRRIKHTSSSVADCARRPLSPCWPCRKSGDMSPQSKAAPLDCGGTTPLLLHVASRDIKFSSGARVTLDITSLDVGLW